MAAAVKAQPVPPPPTTFDRPPFKSLPVPVPDSPWPPHSATETKAPQHNMDRSAAPDRSIASWVSAVAPYEGQHTMPPGTPQDITAPSPSTSETSTVFTDVDEEEQEATATAATADAPDVANDDVRSQKSDVRSPAVSVKSPLTLPKLNTGVGPHLHKAPPVQVQLQIPSQAQEAECEPTSAIHVPSAFTRLFGPVQVGDAPTNRVSQGATISRPASTLSQASSTATAPPESASTESTDRTITDQALASAVTSSIGSSVESTESDVTVRDIAAPDPANIEDGYYDHKATSPLFHNTRFPMSTDWIDTPRAQTRQDLVSFSRPGSSLASISEQDDYESDAGHEISASEDERGRPGSKRFSKTPKSEADALRMALSECWTLCNTLANLSQIHRDRIFAKRSSKGDMQEQAWKSCWKLCKNLYDTRENDNITSKSTLDLCREFCQTLFEIRSRTDEAADSVLRVSFELNNHLFNTHDRTLPEAFRERTLDFYITLCHRLMKQVSKMSATTDALLKACWSLAEMLFSLRQSKRENRNPDEELLGSAVQACWELCDLFREGWTQIRPERGTPKPVQMTFTQAFNEAKKQGLKMTDTDSLKQTMTPETPTTIFEDLGVSPDEAPVPNLIVMKAQEERPKSALSQASAPSLPRPNSTQRMSRPLTRQPLSNRWNSITEMMSEDDGRFGTATPMSATPISATPLSAISSASLTSFSSRASSTHRSVASSQHTIRTPSEDPTMTLLKSLFIRAAVQTGRGFSPDPRNNVGSDATYTSLPLFAKSLPDNAFGSQSWQKRVLENFKRTVTSDNTFRNLGTSALTIGLGTDPEKGKEDIAAAVRAMVNAVHGFGWLRDLFRYGYGAYIDDVLGKDRDQKFKTSTGTVAAAVATIPPGAPPGAASGAAPGAGTGTGTIPLHAVKKDHGQEKVNGVSHGNEGRKLSRGRDVS